MSQTDVKETITDDRRTSARVTFDARIGVTEQLGTAIPADECFRPVKGVNLSQTGISFTTTEWPSQDQLLVRLGEKSKPVHIAARVIDCLREEVGSGDSRFAVRCEFLAWL